MQQNLCVIYKEWQSGSIGTAQAVTLFYSPFRRKRDIYALLRAILLFLSPVRTGAKTGSNPPQHTVRIFWNVVLVRKCLYYVNIMRQIIAKEAVIVKNGATLFVLFL